MKFRPKRMSLRWGAEQSDNHHAARTPKGARVTLRFAAMALMAPVLWASETPAQSAFADDQTSLSGSFLAARLAARQRDNKQAVQYYLRALKEDPGNRILMERAMLAMVAAGEFKTAIGFARRVIKFRPSHRIARTLLALSEFRAGRYAASRHHLKFSRSVPLAQLTSSVIGAWSYIGDGKPKAARKALEALKSVNSLKTFYDFHAALMADISGDIKRADKSYAAAYKTSPRSLRVVQAYGRYLERRGDGARASEVYRKFLAANQNHVLVKADLKRAGTGSKPNRLVPNAKAGVAELLFGVASVLSDEARADIPLRFIRQAIYMRPNFQLARMLMGDIYTGTRRHERAIETYQALPASSPLKRNADIQIASNLNRLKKIDQATAKLREVIKRHPQDYEPLVVLADILRSHSKFAEASKYYTGAIKLIGTPKKNHWLTYYHRGITFERTKRWPRAERDFKKALALNPNQPQVLNYLGYSWVEKRINLKQAMDLIRKAVELRSNDGYIVDSLGWAHYQLGEYRKAVEVLERAVNLRPDDPVINDHLGDAYWKVGRKLEARFQWSHSRDLKPEADLKEKVLKKIKFGLGADAGNPTPSTEVVK